MSGPSTIQRSLFAAIAAILAGSVAVSAAVGPAQSIAAPTQVAANA